MCHEVVQQAYLIHLVPIPLCGNKVIVGMDWLSPNGAVTDCRHYTVHIWAPSGGELVIEGKSVQRKPFYIQQLESVVIFSRVVLNLLLMFRIPERRVR